MFYTLGAGRQGAVLEVAFWPILLKKSGSSSL
jgi:hypothetical protein